ncbi:MICOS complex subunit MIC27 isoform X2 [Plodia interpunctella]|uniref:MICOS complex subunit MIC27 isoform X2 n=1 Tax=Plodia interpunctella TaxID=58824 RepID=UPI002367EEF7|nr:MICOS complex subunit MIC27 isoform X2 [Plodia interpunctella]
MLRKAVFGSSLAAVVPVINAATPLKDVASGPSKPPPMKPSELPIYEAPHAEYVEYQQAKEKEEKPGFVRQALQAPVRAVRESIQTVLAQTESVKNTVSDNYHQVQDKTDWIVKYLREEENKDVRYGAVVMGGLTGLIFGLRGGFIRRVIYTGVGTTTMGLVCFPEDTKEIVKSNGVLAKQYINIAYNFLYGGSFKDDVDDISVENPVSKIC